MRRFRGGVARVGNCWVIRQLEQEAQVSAWECCASWGLRLGRLPTRRRQYGMAGEAPSPTRGCGDHLSESTGRRAIPGREAQDGPPLLLPVVRFCHQKRTT